MKPTSSRAPRPPVAQTGSLYDAMPPVRPVRLWSLPAALITERADPKFAVDALRLLATTAAAGLAIAIPLIAAILLLLLTNVVDLLKKHPTATLVGGILAAILVVAAGSIIIDRRRLSRRLIELDIHHDFELVQCVLFCDVQTPDIIEYGHRYVVRARGKNIRHFPVPFTWTGGGSFEIIARNPSHVISEPRHLYGNMSVVDVDLGRQLSAPDEEIVEFSFLVNTTGEKRTQPYHGLAYSSPKYPLLNTYLIVRFSEEHKPVSLYRDFYYSMFVVRPVKTRAASLDAARMLRWRLVGRVNWRYCIRWVYGG